jgi:hypothetical protein
MHMLCPVDFDYNRTVITFIFLELLKYTVYAIQLPL